MEQNGTPTALLAVFRAWMDVPLAAQYACQALDSILSKYEGNQLFLGEHGLGEGLVRFMALHQHTSPPVVLEYALWALYNLCVDCPSNQTKVGLAGGCEQLVKSLHIHRNHAGLMSQGLRVMMGVAMGHDSNLARVQAPVPVPASASSDVTPNSAVSSSSDRGGRASGFEVVVGAMQLHPDNR